MYQIVYKKAAIRGLRKMPRQIRARVEQAMKRIAENADFSGLDIKRLQGRPGYRLRVGGWRVIYHRADDRLLIVVVTAGVRGDIYK